MIWTLIHIIDWMLWIFIAGSVIYVLFFALVSLFSKVSKIDKVLEMKNRTKFLVLFPAYGEDAVILNSSKLFIRQTYPAEYFDTVVISDHMKEETNEVLRSMPLTLLTPVFEKSSKAKALQFAIANTKEDYDYIVILDADNVVDTDFLVHLDELIASKDYTAIQCHRCAKNSDNEIAVLDGISEEINNTIFRKAHNTIGMSSALIGSGMCFKYRWFKENVNNLTTAGEDRELEALLLRQGFYIKYEDGINVYDEKVSNQDNFQRQRLRWMTAQLQCLTSMLPYIPQAIKTKNIDYIDKTLQQALIPRSILIAVTILLSVISLIISPMISIKWWVLFLCTFLAITIATPRKLRKKSIVKSITTLPKLIWKMCCNIIKIDTSNKDFIHTTHDK